MSLSDAFLLEGYRDPREVWIAIRNDGQPGSGTIDDPFDGGTHLESALGITSLTNTGDEATANAASAHGFINNDVITISGVTGAGAARWNGSFAISGVTSTSFKYRMTGTPAAAPGGGDSILAARIVYSFDEVMGNLEEGSLIHLAAGVFQTRGFAPGVTQGWQARKGQRILGSGMGVTTLKLVHAVIANDSTVAVAHDYFTPPHYARTDDFEASDFTVDCDMRSQAHSVVVKAAIRVPGNHVRIRRIRIVDFGSHNLGVECFGIGVAGSHPNPVLADPHDARIEDCVVEQPSFNGVNNNSCLILMGGEEPAGSGGKQGWHRAGIIRNNYINHEYVDRPVAIQSIAHDGTAWVVTCHAPHGRNNDDWVVISGARDSSGTLITDYYSVHFNGSFEISGVNPSTPTKFHINPAGTPGPATSLIPTGQMWVDRFSSHRISVQKVERAAGDSTLAVLTSLTPHNRKPGQWVYVSQTREFPPTGTEPYFGRFRIEEVSSTTVLTYRMVTAPTKLFVQDFCPVVGPPDPDDCEEAIIFIGNSSVGFSTDGGSEAIAEGNRVFHTLIGGSYHDTFGTRDQTDRNNCYSDVATGPYQNMGRSSELKQGSLSVSGSVATFTTTNPHGLSVGQGVQLSPPVGIPPQEYFEVTAATPTAFTFNVTGSVSLTPPYTFGALWQVGLAVREFNVIDLGQTIHRSVGFGYSSGLAFYSAAHGSQYVFLTVIIRNNIVSILPNSGNPQARAFELQNLKTGIIDQNLQNIVEKPGIAVAFSQPLHFFNNRDLRGTTVQPATGKIGDVLSAQIEDVIAICL